MYVPGRGKVGPSQGSCSALFLLPAQAWVSGAGELGAPRAPPQYLSRRCILHGQPAGGLYLQPGEALPAACAGAVPPPDRTRGKVRAGPSHADAGGLCQQPRAYLLPPWLFAFGEAPAGWGLRRPERRRLGAGGALSGHLRQLLAAPADGKAEGGRGRPKTLRAQLPLVPGVVPQPAAYGARRPGPRDLLCLLAAASVAPFLLRPPLSCQRFERGSGDPELLLRIFGGGGEGGVLSLPHIPPPWKPLGGTCLPTWAGVARGTVTGQEYPYPPGEERGTPCTLHLAAGCVSAL